jgi:prepilin-type N-terminal cleavage/methylation domain-containing protein
VERFSVHPVSRPGAQPPGLPSPARQRAPRALEGGFTLIELIVVVILIGVFAAMAMPQVTRQLRDRRVHEAAQRVALIYQQARLRAMGQGGAVMVRYTAGAGSQGSFETNEALIGTADPLNCPLVPATSCTATDWDSSSSTQRRMIELFQLGTDFGLGGVFATLTPDSANATGTDMDVCFTPVGRTFVRYGASSAWVPLRGVPQLNVYRQGSGGSAVGLTRHVLVLPTGIARLQL